MDSIKQFLEKDTPEVYRLYDRILEGTGDLDDLINSEAAGNGRVRIITKSQQIQ